jgi:GGDEF domain-containing protein
VLPVSAAAPPEQIVARLAAALRVRTLHATVLRRTDTLRHNGAEVPALPANDPLEEATILVVGRGRSYPALTAAISDRVGLIGALSVENAARHLNTREVDGIILGEGFGPSTNVAFLTALLEDSRFRDLPVGVVPDIPPGIDRTRLCGLEPVHGEPEDIVAHLLPLVRIHAFGSRLRRHVAALDARGLIDPLTGLTTVAAFDRRLPRAIAEAREGDVPLSIARFALPFGLPERGRIDAARLVSRLIRAIDFACKNDDGSITVVFAEQALRQAHVIARRIAAAIRQTVLEPHGDRLDAAVTLACLKPADNAQTLLARVCETHAAAAE